MDIKSKIEEIHQSRVYGIIVEIGAGQPLAERLFDVSGASNTIHESLSAYSHLAQESRYGVDFLNEIPRNVSREAVSRMIDIEASKLTTMKSINSDYQNINMIWVNSFQISSDGCSHGWIGVHYIHENGDSNTRFYHLTINRTDLTRPEIIKEIGHVSVDILYQLINRVFECLDYVDGIFNDNKKELSLKQTIKCSNYYFVINPQGYWERLEETFRKSKNNENNTDNFIIYKGSFNPFHTAHQQIIDKAKELFPGAPVGLMLSVNTYQKGQIDCHSLSQRIKSLNSKGFYVIISNKGMYQENLGDLNQRLPNQHWIFPMGWDTFIRLENSEILFPTDVNRANFTYLVFNRNKGFNEIKLDDCELHKRTKHKVVKLVANFNNPISSTQIRNNK